MAVKDQLRIAYSITTQVACAVATVIPTLRNIHNASGNDVINGLRGKKKCKYLPFRRS